VRWPPVWELVIELLRFIRELLLLEAGSRSTGIVREPKVRGTSPLFTHNRSGMVAVLGPFEALPYYIQGERPPLKAVTRQRLVEAN
jgi:hypothetical protein